MDKQQSLQQFAYKPTQDRIPSSTQIPQPTAAVAPHPRGSGWENIDLCQQRSKGTQEWNLQQPYGKIL